MSDDPRQSTKKVAPHLLGIAALAVILLACIRNDRAPREVQSPFREAARRLRIGMTIEEALSSINLQEPDAGSGSMTHANFVFFDEGRDEVLSLHFRRAAWSGGCLPTNQLTEWKVTKPPR